MRIPPVFPESFASPTLVGRPRNGLVRQMRSYELITPLFGGGVEKGVPDPDLPVTGKMVRGQLRFWWRALRAGAFGDDLQALKRAEDALWGCATQDGVDYGSSRVEVNVVVRDPGHAQSPFRVVVGKPGRDGRPRPKLVAVEGVAPAYVAFPLQPTVQEMNKGGVGMETKTVQVGVQFDLELVFPQEQHKELLQTLWLWETFGGVGGRTRRGFGALRLVSIDGDASRSISWNAPVPAGVPAYLHKSWNNAKLSQGNWFHGVPHLAQFNLALNRDGSIFNDTPMKVWQELVGCYQSFRQTKIDDNPHGRSHWPEADACRFATDRDFEMKDGHFHKFPRGALGLPIIFHFQKNELPDMTLEAAGHERWASPLIIKPLACANNRAVGLIAAFEPAFPPSLEDSEPRPIMPMRLHGAGGQWMVDGQLTPREAQFPPLDGQPDVLQECIRYLIG